MKVLNKILLWVLTIMNILVVSVMIICAYSVYLNPLHFPNWSYIGMTIPIFIIGTIVFIPIWLIIKWKFSLISIIGLIICCKSIRDYCPFNPFKGDPEGKTIKVMSYNVYSFGGYTYDENNTGIVDYIVNSKADLICMQEVGNINKDKIYNALNKAYPYIEIGDSTETDCAVLSQYPILSLKHIRLGTKSSSCYVYDILIGNDTVKVVNCHLESYQFDDDDKKMYEKIINNSNPLNDNTIEKPADLTNLHDNFGWLEKKLAKANSARSIQVDTINNLVKQFNNKYIILCGDFNDTPVSYSHKTLTENLKDAYTESGNGPGWSYKQNDMYFRIDHILTSQSFNSFLAKIDQSVQESDHYPIFCTLEMH